jgi:DNA-binding GntR family transcriptional regulator
MLQTMISLTNKQEYAYKKIKDMIISNEFMPGEMLIERNLCERLSISRTPIRAALAQLANERLVLFQPGRGMAIAPFDRNDVLDIYELREVLDVLAIKLFMNNVTKNLLAEMEHCLIEMEIAFKRNDFQTIAKFDIHFHAIYLNNTKNMRLQPMLSTLTDQINRLLNMVDRNDRNHIFNSLKEHREIYEAVAQGDVQQARQTILQHILSIKEYHLARILEGMHRNE